MILKGNLFSQILEMETAITIITPEEFHSGRNNYKTCYLLHGLCGRSGDWVDYTMLPNYAKEYNTIIIMPEVARSFYTDMKHGLRYFTYITDELPQMCRSIFNISAKREDTAVIGASMGGYGALKCALSKPEQFGYCCAFSSACLFLKDGLDKQRGADNIEEIKAIYGEQLINDFVSIFGEKLEWNRRDEILELAKILNGQTVKPKIYTACGSNDPLSEDNQKFNKCMKKLDFEFTYEEWKGNHDWYFFNEALRKALKFCFGENIER